MVPGKSVKKTLMKQTSCKDIEFISRISLPGAPDDNGLANWKHSSHTKILNEYDGEKSHGKHLILFILTIVKVYSLFGSRSYLPVLFTLLQGEKQGFTV